MSPFTLCLNQNVSAAFIGLTASGYDMADLTGDNELSGVSRKIAAAYWSPETIAYFSNARTSSCRVNPYWPRAFFLILAALYLPLDPPMRFPNAGVMSAHVDRLDMIGPSERGASVIEWINGLPEAVEQVRSSPAFPEIWRGLQADFDVRRAGYEQVLGSALAGLHNRLGVNSADLPSVTVVVNRLGARQADDFVEVDGTVYAITADPDPTGILHEILYHLLARGSKRLPILFRNIESCFRRFCIACSPCNTPGMTVWTRGAAFSRKT